MDDKRLYRNVQLRLERDRDSMYWRVREGCSSKVSIPADKSHLSIYLSYTGWNFESGQQACRYRKTVLEDYP